MDIRTLAVSRLVVEVDEDYAGEVAANYGVALEEVQDAPWFHRAVAAELYELRRG